MITNEEANLNVQQGVKEHHVRRFLVDYISQQEKVMRLLGLYQDLFKKLELTVEHDTTDTWAGCVEYNYVEINGGITDEVETVEKIEQLKKELGK